MTEPKSLVSRIFAVLISVLMIVLGVALLYFLAKMNLLPSKLLIIVCVIFLLLITFLVIFVWIYKPYVWQKIICGILVVVLLCVEGVGAAYLYKADSTLGSITSVGTNYTSVVQVIVLKDSSIENPNGLEGKTMGILKTLDELGTKAVEEDLTDKGITVKEKKYDSLINLVQALYDKKVDAISLNSNYRNTVIDQEEFKNFDSETKVIDEISYTTKRTASTVAVDDITQTPFTILISGSDSRNGLAETARSDSNMIVTINPNEKTILLVSIPRDFYVETVCDGAAGCPDGQMDKLTHTGLFGVETTKKTLEKVFGITINYTVRINFDAVTNLVDALGGIDIYVEPGLAVSSFLHAPNFSVSEGWNSVNGAEALAFARERYAYAAGDHQRIKNQQIVLEAIFDKATSPALITQYNKFMDALTGAMETDLTQDEIQSLIKFQLDGNPDWTFYEFSVSGTGGTDFCAAAGSNAYVMYPDSGTVAKAKTLIDACLDGNSKVLEDFKNGLEVDVKKAAEKDDEAIIQDDEDTEIEDDTYQDESGIPYVDYIPDYDIYN